MGVSASKEERVEAWGSVSVDRGSGKVHQERRAGPGSRDISESDGGENPERMSKGTRVLISGRGDGELGISRQEHRLKNIGLPSAVSSDQFRCRGGCRSHPFPKASFPWLLHCRFIRPQSI